MAEERKETEMSELYAERMVEDHPPPLGNRVHLHFLVMGWGGGQPVWVLRSRKSSLCGTKRCRRVCCLESFIGRPPRHGLITKKQARRLIGLPEEESEEERANYEERVQHPN